MKSQNHFQSNVSGKNTRSNLISFFNVILVFAVASFVLSSCRKKEETPDNPAIVQDTEQSTSEDNNRAESYVSDIESIGGQVSDEGSLSTFKTSGSSDIALETAGCASLIFSGQSFTVDFGTSGCVGSDGRTRTGKLIYNFAASSSSTALHYRNPGFNMTVTSQNYVVDSYSVNIINKTISNTTPNTIPSGLNPGTNLTWAITASVTIVKPNNAGTITWSCNRTKELMNTNDSICYRGQNLAINWSKAIVKLNGSSSGVNARGENYTAVASNLVRNFNCSPDPIRVHRHPFISGTITYIPGSRPTRTIDFGNGACDLNATVTINGNSYAIVLP